MRQKKETNPNVSSAESRFIPTMDQSAKFDQLLTGELIVGAINDGCSN